jgi:hypothetical protein
MVTKQKLGLVITTLAICHPEKYKQLTDLYGIKYKSS